MNLLNILNDFKHKKYYLLIGLVGLVLAVVIDYQQFNRVMLFDEYLPNFYWPYLIRSTIILTSIMIIFFGLLSNNTPELKLFDTHVFPIRLLIILITIFISLYFLLLFFFRYDSFYQLSLEDGLIESGSAFFLFLSSIVFVILSFNSRNYLNLPKFSKLIFIFLAFIFFLIGMEEVSWFQRQVGFETPAVFSQNAQMESNLHNFATDYVENAYYFGAFVFLVLLPALKFLLPKLFWMNFFDVIIARPYIVVIAVVACAYNFDMWNIIFTQIAFFSSLVILFLFFILNKHKIEKFIILITLVLIFITQIIFLTNGSKFVRPWEITEYKEFFIPLAFFIYSVDVFVIVKRNYKNKVKIIAS